MDKKSLNDLVVDTMGRCFLCSNPTSLPSSTTHSLQHLSRYLKMDLSKVFQTKGLISQSLLDKVIASQLRASLCETCISLNKRVSELCRQLEKIQMGVMNCLELVKDNLEGAMTSDNNLPNETDNNSEDGKWTLCKMEIADILRKEAVQKCNRMLTSRVPRAKIQNLTSNQVHSKQTLIKSRYRSTVEKGPFPSSFNGSEPEVEIGYMKQEPKFEDHGERHDEWPENEDGNSPDHFGEPVEMGSRMEKPNRHLKLDEPSKPIAIPSPIKIKGVAGKSTGQSYFNPSSKKYRCRQCQKEYANAKHFYIHYDRIHLQIKFKCPICSLESSSKQRYDYHYLAKHAGVQYDCLKCGKIFSRKLSLQNHDRIAHLFKDRKLSVKSKQVPLPLKVVGRIGKPEGTINPKSGKLKCRRCDLEFRTYPGLERHYRAVHLNERYVCTLCKKDFSQKTCYKYHYLNFHMNV